MPSEQSSCLGSPGKSPGSSAECPCCASVSFPLAPLPAKESLTPKKPPVKPTAEMRTWHTLGEEGAGFWTCFLDILNFPFPTMAPGEELPLTPGATSPLPRVWRRKAQHILQGRAGAAGLASPGTKGNVKNPEVSQGSSRSTPGPGQTGSTGHVPHRKAQAADLMQKSLTQLCLSCSWGSKMPRKPSQHHLGPHLPKELFLSAGTAAEHPPVPSTAPALTASPGRARYHQPHPALPSWAGGKPQPCQGSPTAEPQNQSRN